MKDGERRGCYCCFVFSWDMSVIGSSFGCRKGGGAIISIQNGYAYEYYTHVYGQVNLKN